MSKTSLLVTLLTALLLPSYAFADAREIGAAAVIRNSVSGSLGGNNRALTVGDRVYLDEEIKTGDKSAAQMLFLDETALNLGPRSEVTLSRLVYDPDKNVGEVTVNAISGSFRFITGSSPKENYKIDTPVGTIGVRGTILEIILRRGWMFLAVPDGAAQLCVGASGNQCVDLPTGTYAVTDGKNLSGAQSLASRGCGGSGSSAGKGGRSYCTVTEDGQIRLFIQRTGPAIAIFDTPFDQNLTPPPIEEPPVNEPPVNEPPVDPPQNDLPTDGFSPVLTPNGQLPPGLDPNNLPAGLVKNRDPETFEPRGFQKGGGPQGQQGGPVNNIQGTSGISSQSTGPGNTVGGNNVGPGNNPGRGKNFGPGNNPGRGKGLARGRN